MILRNELYWNLISVMLFLFVGCDLTKLGNDDEGLGVPVARVYDKYLYDKDLSQIVTPGTTPTDSAVLVKSYIDNWIKKNVILYKAEKNLSAVQKEVEQQLQEYRNSLITFMYEKELINQQLDTVVSEAEIEQYYKENERNFELKDNIVKVIYLKTKSEAPKLDNVKGWLRSDKTKDRLKLEEYCYQFASDFYLDEDTWLPFDELLKKVPLNIYDKESFLRNNRYVEVKDSTDIYLVNIKDRKIRESLSPLSFVSEDIRNLIINKRKLQLISEMERSAYDEALRNNDFEIYSE